MELSGKSEMVVQQSFPEPRPTTNPYIVMLREALASTTGVTVQTFSWRRALRGGYDIFHVHWPEILVQGRTPARRLVRQILFGLLILRLRVGRIPVVRTQHNLHLPSGLSRRQRVLLKWLDHRTTLRIALNQDTLASLGSPAVVIPHGHYRDWFAQYPRSSRRGSTYAYFGLIRRYKNVEGLIRSFSHMSGEISLRVAGKPSTIELADTITRLASADPRIQLSLEFLTDAELVEVATSAELVVLPYTHMHNSGGVLASLSLGTPVLVPATPTNSALAEEVGPGWVLQYEGELEAADLRRALEVVRAQRKQPPPDLSRRGWEDAGSAHLAAYTSALDQFGRRSRRRSRRSG